MLNIKMSGKEMEDFQKIIGRRVWRKRGWGVGLKLFNRISLRRPKPAENLQRNDITFQQSHRTVLAMFKRSLGIVTSLPHTLWVYFAIRRPLRGRLPGAQSQHRQSSLQETDSNHFCT